LGIDDAVCADPQVFIRHPDIAPVVIPSGEGFGRRLKLIPQRGGPEAESRSGSVQPINNWKLTATSLSSALWNTSRQLEPSI
jgi:hypothetical protein